MSPDEKTLKRKLAKIVGQEYVFTDKSTALVYAKDTMPWDVEAHNIPYSVVRPGSSEEISGVLKLASKMGVPVHTHGSGTSLVGLGRPKARGVVLDMGRFQEFKAYPERGYFEVGAGMHIGNVRKKLNLYNSMLPVFPGSELIATIGGAVSVNTSAHAVDATLCKPGDYVLGLEVVMPDGTVLKTGTESARKPAGIEMTKFLVGSEGLLCVITKIRMRLIPDPWLTNIVAYYPSTEDILDTVMAMYKKAVHTPLFFEYLDEKSSRVGYEAVGLEAPKGAVAMMSIHDSTQKGCREKANEFLDFLKETAAEDLAIIEDEQKWKKIWGSRSEAGNYVYRLGSTFGSEITPKVNKLKLAFQEMKGHILNLQSYKNPEFYSFGHIGAPTIHAYAFIPSKTIPNDIKRNVALEVRTKSEDLNVKYGGCGGEWGLTAQRVNFLKKKYGQEYYDILVALKKSLDPKNILNRGNLEGWF